LENKSPEVDSVLADLAEKFGEDKLKQMSDRDFYELYKA
jgi:hypothetical protein